MATVAANGDELERDKKDQDSQRGTVPQTTTAQKQQGRQADAAAAAAAAAKRVQKEFIDDWRTGWLMRRKTYPASYANQECWVPIRTATGRLEFRCSGPSKASRFSYKAAGDYQPYMYKAWWYGILDNTWEARSKPPQGKPPRWVRVPLSKGMKVSFDRETTDRLGRDVIKGLIGEVNAAHKEEREIVKERMKAALAAVVAAKPVDKQQRKTDAVYLASLAELAYLERLDKEEWVVKQLGVGEKLDSNWIHVSANPGVSQLPRKPTKMNSDDLN